MKRLGLIAILFIIALVFTQCNKCNNSCCGESFTEPNQPIGFTSVMTEFDEDNSWPTVVMSFDFKYARVETPFSFIPSAYACSPPIWIISLDNQIDSIQVVSEPSYIEGELEEVLYYSSDNLTLAEYNAGIKRNLISIDGKDYTFILDALPTQSDSFTFSFYYFKDGAIIDSSSTQKFYVSK